MSGQSVVEQIRHYQKDIDRCPENTERMMRCLQRLYVLPIQVQHLQETGVGRSVNSLRKYTGDVGYAAKALVCKWKAMVVAEELSDGEQTQVKPNKILEVPDPLPSSQPVIKEVSKKDHQIGKERNSDHKSSSSKHQNGRTSSSTSSSRKRSHSSSNSRDHGSSKKHSSERAKKEVRRSTSPEAASAEEEDEVKNSGHKSKKRHTSSYKKEDKKQISESEDEASDNSDRMQVADVENSEESSEDDSQEEKESQSSVDEESDSSSDSSDHRHRSKHHKVSSSHHHKHKSSHSSSRENGHHSSSSSASGKDKGRHRSSSKSDKHSASTDKKHTSSKTKDLKELIKENEEKVKKENFEFEVPKQKVSQSGKNVKIERNEDGSIDSGSGVGFGDVLLVVDKMKDSSKKKKPSTSTSSSRSSSSHKSSSSSSKPSSGSHHSSSSSSHSSSSRSHHSSSRDKSSKTSSSHSNTTDLLSKPPELLTKKIKLEALDLDISSTLPEISPNYKPLPQIPENMRRSVKNQNETDAMVSIMTTKNQRTKVFSGNKAAQQSVQSLFQMCIQILYENIDAVEYTGGVPFDLLKQLLERLNADQLYVLEHYNPYLIDDTDLLWKFHCNKDFRSEQRQDMESWRELYLRCVDERERKLKTLTAKVSESMAKSTPVRQAKLAYVDTVVKPPRNVARKQAKYGTGSSTPVSSNTTKQAIVSKAVVGGHTPGVSADEAVPPPPMSSRPSLYHPTSSSALKKKKAPLMQKALQFIKGNRYKR